MRTCFTGDTPLLVESGSKRADEIREGDKLLSQNEHDPEGVVEEKEVEEVFIRVSPILNVHVGEQIIRTTGEHPFYVVDRGWIPAAFLEIGDLLQSHDKKLIPVEGVADSGEVTTVYNFRIADYHTYFVGSESWGFSLWAHNANAQYRTNFFKKNPDLKGEVWVHHAVEQQVVKRYPGLFSKVELDSLGNLRGIPKDINSELHLSFIRRAWNRFYRSFPNAQRQEIEHYADVIDRFVGHRFSPPL